MDDVGCPGAEWIAQVEGFFSACDLVKFAKYFPSQAENGASVERAFRILESCKKQRSAPVTSVVVSTAGVK